MAQERLGAKPYRFTTIADSSDPQFSGFAYNGTPAVNNEGVVAFGATLTDGTSGIFTGSGGELTLLVDTSGPFDEFLFEDIAINTAGTVAFRATLDTGDRGVFTVNSGVVSAVADSTDGFNDFQGVSINDAGTVAFYGQGYDDVHDESFIGVYKREGGTLSTIVESRVSSAGIVDPLPYGPSINNLGEVAFFADGEEGSGIYIGDGASLTQIVKQEGAWDKFRLPARCPINDSGEVAFVADNENRSVRGVFKYSGGTVAKIVDYNDLDPNSYIRNSFHDFTDVMINNSGTVAFGGLYDDLNLSWTGVYTGADPDTDKVVAFGDMVGGLTSERTYFWGRSLNDRGEVAFYAESTTGSGIYLATPVPEPAGLALMLDMFVPIYWWSRATKRRQ